MEINCAVISDVGKKRDMNQDALYTIWNNNWGLFVLADGMGGTNEGDRASNEIADAYRSWAESMSEEIEEMELGELLTSLKTVLSEANDKIKKETKQGETCGSTVVILLVKEDFYMILSAGDSRIYEVSEKFFFSKLKQLTVDDVYTYQGIDSGKLTNAVGIFSQMKCNVITQTLKNSHTFFLCTDGVYKYCSEKKILQLITEKSESHLEEKVKRIKDAIYENGAGDNLSMILVECKK